MLTMLALAGGVAAAQPSITFDSKQVIATGISPGGTVALYGVAHDFQAVLPELLRWARELTDDDRDGAVTFQVPREVPLDSQWFVVDMTTGELAASSPRGGDPREVPFDGPGIVDSHASPRAALRVRRAIADILVVRSGEGSGSWLLLAGDNADGDSDSAPDGFISGALASFQAVGRTAAIPSAFARADLAVVVDPFSLEYSILGGKGR